MRSKLTVKEINAIAKDAAERLNMSFLKARGLTRKYHPVVEESVVVVLSGESRKEIIDWWRMKREEYVLTAMIYGEVSKKVARRQARFQIGRLLKQA